MTDLTFLALATVTVASSILALEARDLVYGGRAGNRVPGNGRTLLPPRRLLCRSVPDRSLHWSSSRSDPVHRHARRPTARRASSRTQETLPTGRHPAIVASGNRGSRVKRVRLPR